MKHLVLTFSILITSISALAEDNAVKTTADAISVASDKFSSEESASTKLYAGIKGWPSGSATLVRVYLSNNTSMNYSCEMMVMDGNNMMMCDKK